MWLSTSAMELRRHGPPVGRTDSSRRSRSGGACAANRGCRDVRSSHCGLFELLPECILHALSLPLEVQAGRCRCSGDPPCDTPLPPAPGSSPSAPTSVGMAVSVYSMQVDGSDVTRMTFRPTDDRRPTYSPDGSRIAFSSQVSAGGDILPQLQVMTIDGSCVRQLTRDGGADPSWSPDGREIVYSRYNWLSNAPENGVLWIVNVETLDEHQLTEKWPERPPPVRSATPGIR